MHRSNEQMFTGFRNNFEAGNGPVLYISVNCISIWLHKIKIITVFFVGSVAIYTIPKLWHFCPMHHNTNIRLCIFHSDQMPSIIHFACWMVRWFPIIWKLQISQHFLRHAFDWRLLLIASGEKPFCVLFYFIRCDVILMFLIDAFFSGDFFSSFLSATTIQYYVIWYRYHETFVIIQFIHSGGVLINDTHSPVCHIHGNRVAKQGNNKKMPKFLI